MRISRSRTSTLAPRLVAIHPAVGRSEQRFVGFAVVREDGGADADGERQNLGRARLEPQFVYRPLQLESLRSTSRPHPATTIELVTA